MNISNIIAEYDDAEYEERKQIIEKYLLPSLAAGEYTFLEHLAYWQDPADLCQQSMPLILASGMDIMPIAKRLLEYEIEHNCRGLAMGICAAEKLLEGANSDIRPLLPLLIRLYFMPKYRDADHSLSGLLRGFFYQPLHIFVQQVQENPYLNDENRTQLYQEMAADAVNWEQLIKQWHTDKWAEGY